MDVLVIGGSVFVGRAVVDEARAVGASVTVFNRGRSAPQPDGVEQIVGDRTSSADLAQLRRRRFDLVVDTCGYVPADVAAGAAAVDAEHYVFVSTISVFPSWPGSGEYPSDGPHAGDPDATRADVPDGLDAYGWLKAGCEQAVLRERGAEVSTILRAGAIVGPHDGAVGRLPWWIARIARGEVLVPGRPEDPIALVDARDIARFALGAVPGVFETAGPPGRDARSDLMAACLQATGSEATLTWVPDAWLRGRVTPWTEVPLWVPREDAPGTFASHSGSAAAAGLTWRPLATTVADTWAWQQSVPDGWSPTAATPGLAPERELDLLAAWHAET